MEKLNRFVAKHLMPLYWIGVIVWIFAISIPANRYDMPAVVQFFLYIAGLFLWIRFLGSRARALLREPTKMFLEQCDPYPFLEEIRKHKTYSGSKATKLNLLISETTAMIDIGECQEVYILLSPKENDMKATLMRSLLMPYYCQMATVCRKLQKDQEAEIWFQKALEAYGKIKNQKQKKQFEDVALIHDAWVFFEKGQYSSTLQLLAQITPENMRSRVSLSMSYAAVYLAQKDTEKAKEALTFVAENGNKLYIATQARQMLAEIEETTHA